ncbi:MAG: cyclic nucleotide-binding domain-containing protein [Rhizobiaceae bacterium]
MNSEMLFSYDTVGLLGVVMYISAYASLQLRLHRGTDYTYILMNLCAATLVLISLSNNFNLSSAIIQVTWITISLFGLGWTIHSHYSTKLSEEESAFIRAKFPSMSKRMARRFLNAGVFIDAEEGTSIATEGEPINALIYLQSGSAEFTLGGKTVGSCTHGTLLGELTCFDGTPATTSVVLSSPARYFLISTEALNRICNADSDLRIVLESAITQGLRTKFATANEQLSLKPV